MLVLMRVESLGNYDDVGLVRESVLRSVWGSVSLIPTASATLYCLRDPVDYVPLILRYVPEIRDSFVGWVPLPFVRLDF
jgi:hypothetical protein